MKLLSLLLFCFLTVSCSENVEQNSGDSNDLIVRFKTDKTFADVVEELDFSITEKNFRITGRNTVGKGMRNRGYENYPDIEVIHFCSLDVAREVLDLDPGYVAQMPCRVTVHEEEDYVVVSLILLPTNHKDPRVNAFAKKMNITLREIVDYALEENSTPL
ncbi:MAG: DUF302 domain-containing protein [Gammaproteobacteria bacterium]